MKQKLEIIVLSLIAGLLTAYVVLDDSAQPAHANDGGGKIAVFSKGGQNAGDNFFLVDTERKWIGLYTIQNSKGPRLVSAQSYQLAEALAELKLDSENERVENPNGWSVKESNDNLERIQKELAKP